MSDGRAGTHGRLQCLRLVRDYYLPRGATTAVSALVAVVAAADIAAPWLVMLAIDLLVSAEGAGGGSDPGPVFAHLLQLGAALAGVCCAQFAARHLMTRIQARTIYRGTADLRADLYDRLQRQSLDFHTGRRGGEMLSHLMADVQVLQDSAVDLFAELPFDAMVLLGLSVAVFALDPRLGMLLLAFFTIAALIALKLGRRGWAAQGAVLEHQASMMADLQEGLHGMRTLVLQGAAGREHQRLRSSVDSQARRLEQSNVARTVVTPFLGLSEYLGIVLALTLGGWSMLHGHLTAGGLVALLAYMQMTAEPMTRAAEMVERLQRFTAAGDRLLTLLEETEPPAATAGRRRPPSVTGRIAVKGLGFRHAGRRLAALQGLDFTVEPGELVLVQGHSGAGKSTLLDLLAGLRTATEGRIEVDGIDLAEIDPGCWRSAIGVVPQEVFLANRTIADNIGLGAADLPAIQRAAERAGMHDFIMRLPAGYQTMAGDRGVLLSGGERQRIAIARLFLRDPRIVLLDEPTSSVDAETSLWLHGAFRRLFAARTTFLATHESLMGEAADKVLVLEHGRQTYFGPPAAAPRVAEKISS